MPSKKSVARKAILKKKARMSKKSRGSSCKACQAPRMLEATAVTNLLKAIAGSNYSAADKYLTTAIEEKIKARIAQTI